MIIGAAFAVPAVQSIMTDAWSIPLLLSTIAGCGVILTAVYRMMQTDPDEFTVSTRMLALHIGAACLVVLGTLLSTVFG